MIRVWIERRKVSSKIESWEEVAGESHFGPSYTMMQHSLVPTSAGDDFLTRPGLTMVS